MEVTRWLESQDAIEFCQEIISLIRQLNPVYPPVVPDAWLERGGQIAAGSIGNQRLQRDVFGELRYLIRRLPELLQGSLAENEAA